MLTNPQYRVLSLLRGLGVVNYSPVVVRGGCGGYCLSVCLVVSLRHMEMFS